MKELQESEWKNEVLKNFKQTTHSGFSEEVMDKIIEIENKPAQKPAPLISAQQWFFTSMIASFIVLFSVLVLNKVVVDFHYIEDYSIQLMNWINLHLKELWSLFALIGVFFIYTLFKQRIFS